MCVCSPSAFAQVLAYNPAQIQQQFDLPKAAKPVPPAPVSPTIEKPSLPETDDRFLLTGIKIIGMTSIDQSATAPLINPLINSQVSLADLQQLADKLTRLYRDAGFILSRVILPSQTIDGGVVQLQALEGYISAITINGLSGKHVLLQQYAQRVLAERPITQKTLDRYLLLANDLPGIGVQALMAPSQTEPVAAEMIWQVQKDSLSGFVGMDNRGTNFIGRNQWFTGVVYNDLYGRGDVSSVRLYTATPAGDLQYIQLSHALGLGTGGMRLSTNVDYSTAKPGASLRLLAAESEYLGVTTTLTYPLLRARDKNINLSLSAKYTNTTSILLRNPDSLPSTNDRVRALTFTIQHDWIDDGLGNNNVSLDLSRGFDLLNSSADNRRNPSRPNASPLYWRANLNASRNQPLPWLFSSASFYTATQLQYAFNRALLASEQLSLGGAQYGRGFDSASISGDNGVAAKAELRYDQPLPELKVQSQFYLFSDYGYVTDSRRATDLPTRRLLSAGAGVRLNSVHGWVTNFEYAKKLPYSQTGSGPDDPRTGRFYVNLYYSF